MARWRNSWYSFIKLNWGVRWPTHEVSTPKITICKNCVWGLTIFKTHLCHHFLTCLNDKHDECFAIWHACLAFKHVYKVQSGGKKGVQLLNTLSSV